MFVTAAIVLGHIFLWFNIPVLKFRRHFELYIIMHPTGHFSSVSYFLGRPHITRQRVEYRQRHHGTPMQLEESCYIREELHAVYSRSKQRTVCITIGLAYQIKSDVLSCVILRRNTFLTSDAGSMCCVARLC